MKKIFLILTLSFILFSCSNKEQNNDNSPITSSWNTTINTWSLNNTGAINQTLTWTNTEVKVEEIVKIKKEAKKEWNNIFLYEDNVKKDSLTTYWNSQNTDYTNCNWDTNKKLVAYNILYSDEKYSFIEKSIYYCDWKWLRWDEWLNYYILSFDEKTPNYYKLADYSLPKVNDFSPSILIDNSFYNKYSFVIYWSDWDSYWEAEMKKLWYKKDWEWMYSSYIKVINFEEEYNKAKALVDDEKKKEEARKQNWNNPIEWTYKANQNWRSYDSIKIKNIKNNTFDFSYFNLYESEFEENDKNRSWNWVWKKEWNKWKVYVDMENWLDMLNCTADVDFLPEWVKISNINSCEDLHIWVYK